MKKILILLFIFICFVPLNANNYKKISNIRNSYSEIGILNNNYIIRIESSSIYDNMTIVYLGSSIEDALNILSSLSDNFKKLKKDKIIEITDANGNKLFLRKGHIFNKPYIEITTEGNKGSSTLTRREIQKINKQLKKNIMKR